MEVFDSFCGLMSDFRTAISLGDIECYGSSNQLTKLGQKVVLWVLSLHFTVMCFVGIFFCEIFHKHGP